MFSGARSGSGGEAMAVDRNSGSLEDGQRIGRFVVLRDLGGQVHAVSAGSVGAVCETDDGSLLLLPGGRLIQVGQSLATVLAWLDGRGPPSGAAICTRYNHPVCITCT